MSPNDFWAERSLLIPNFNVFSPRFPFPSALTADAHRLHPTLARYQPPISEGTPLVSADLVSDRADEFLIGAEVSAEVASPVYGRH